MILVSTIQTLLVLGFVFSATLIVGGLVGRYGVSSLKRVSIYPVVAGVLFGLALLVKYPDHVGDSLDYFTGSRDRFGVGLGSAAATILATDFGLQTVLRSAILRFGQTTERALAVPYLRRLHWYDLSIAGIAIFGFGLLVVAGTTIGLNSPGAALTTESETSDVILAAYPLPGAPTALYMQDEKVGYAALIEGRIVRFELPEIPTDQALVTIVAEGLERPHGITVLDGTLFVTEQGVLPCTNYPPKQLCSFAFFENQGMDRAAAEVLILEMTRGRVTAFDIAADGSLFNKRTILDDLPVVNSEHAVNSVFNGSDGWIYLSIGGLDVPQGYVENPDSYLTADIPRLDYVGTVVRFRPDGSESEVFAGGFRNIFGLTADPEGNLFGIDNDGRSGRGDYRAEEILMIEQGKHYGWPYEGTYTQPSERTGLPIGTVRGVGSAGLEWADNADLGAGLLVGGVSRIDQILLERDDNGYYLDRRLPRVLVDDLPPSYVTGIVGIGDGRLLISTYGFGQLGEEDGLLLLDFTQQ